MMHGVTVLWRDLAFELYFATGIGIVISWFSHQKNSRWIGICFLMSHLTLEWIGHAKHGSHYSEQDMVLYAIHTIFDIGLLWILLIELNRGLAPFLFASVTACLVTMFCMFQPETESLRGFAKSIIPVRPHQHVMQSPLEFIVWGGLIGCVSAHIFRSIWITRSLDSR